MICDYNGWNDAPEEEREWFDQHPEIWGGASRENEFAPTGSTGPVPLPDTRATWPPEPLAPTPF